MQFRFPHVNRTHGISWSPKDSKFLDEIAEELDMTAEGVLRLAFRAYQYRRAMAKEGWPNIRYADKDGNLKPIDMPAGCGGDE